MTKRNMSSFAVNTVPADDSAPQGASISVTTHDRCMRCKEFKFKWLLPLTRCGNNDIVAADAQELSIIKNDEGMQNFVVLFCFYCITVHVYIFSKFLCVSSLKWEVVIFQGSFTATSVTIGFRADSRFAPSQWETAFLCNDVYHWLGANLESALWLPQMRWTAMKDLVNSSWAGDAIWRHRSGSTLAQVMACCLTAPSHYLNQCWLFIREVQWQSPEGNFTRNASAINYYNQLENHLPKLSFKSPRGQWVNIGSGNGLTAPSNYLTQYWLIIGEVLRNIPQGNY